jgi:hypothetical protein
MTMHRYPTNALTGDYARAAIGLALTLGPSAMVAPGSGALWILLPLATLFAVFALRTVSRHVAVVELADDSVAIRTWRRVALPWREMRQLKVDYYSTRGDRAGGWMQLTAKGAGVAIRVDSAIEEFVAIARAAADAARANGVEVSEATRVNLAHLGIAIDA